MKNFRFALVLILLFIPASAAADVHQTGRASWYGGEFHLQLTANGEIFDTYQISAAHRDLPFGTVVKVTNLENDRSVDVRINDRGPFVKGRIIDLSYAAAKEIDMIGPGTAPVELRILYLPDIPEDHYHRLPDAAYYRIQTAAFASPQRAQALQKELAEAGYEAAIVEGEDQLFRVFIRNVGRSQLEQTVLELEEQGYSSVLIRGEEK